MILKQGSVAWTGPSDERPAGSARPLPRRVRRRDELSRSPAPRGRPCATPAPRVRLRRPPATADATVRRRADFRGESQMKHRTQARGCAPSRVVAVAGLAPSRVVATTGAGAQTSDGSRRHRQGGEARLHLLGDRRRRVHVQERRQGVPGARRPPRTPRVASTAARSRSRSSTTSRRAPNLTAAQGPGAEPQRVHGVINNSSFAFLTLPLPEGRRACR